MHPYFPHKNSTCIFLFRIFSFFMHIYKTHQHTNHKKSHIPLSLHVKPCMPAYIHIHLHIYLALYLYFSFSWIAAMTVNCSTMWPCLARLGAKPINLPTWYYNSNKNACHTYNTYWHYFFHPKPFAQMHKFMYVRK